MKNDETTKQLPGEPDVAEGKRTAARRRFLKGSAAAGTGIFVVTFHHQRAIAGSKKIMTSSAATCLSLHGTPGKTTTVKDKKTGGSATGTECTLPSSARAPAQE
jgi:hypothetical protein